MDWLKNILNNKGELFGAEYSSDINSNNHSLWLNTIFDKFIVITLLKHLDKIINI